MYDMMIWCKLIHLDLNFGQQHFAGAAITPWKSYQTRSSREPSTSKIDRDAENSQTCQNILSIYIQPFQKCKKKKVAFYYMYFLCNLKDALASIKSLLQSLHRIPSLLFRHCKNMEKKFKSFFFKSCSTWYSIESG